MRPDKEGELTNPKVFRTIELVDAREHFPVLHSILDRCTARERPCVSAILLHDLESTCGVAESPTTLEIRLRANLIRWRFVGRISIKTTSR